MIRRRPMRFLVVVLGGWTAIRVAALWPDASPVPAAIAAAAADDIDPPFDPAMRTADAARLLQPAIDTSGRANGARQAAPVARPAARYAPAASVLPIAELARVEALAGIAPVDTAIALAAPLRYDTAASVPVAATTRWSASSWAVARGGRATAFAPQLGGSQAGARLAYALDDGGRLAVAGRISAALGRRQREGAIGLEWRPVAAVPVRLVAEQRVGLGGIRGGPALGLVGGVDRMPVTAGLAVSGYGQAGGIARSGLEGYVDGALRLGRAVGEWGGIGVDLSAGAWGGAQRGARRLDLGPSVGLTLPTGSRAMRLSLDWRQRIAGQAGPASGPAISIGSDF